MTAAGISGSGRGLQLAQAGLGALIDQHLAEATLARVLEHLRRSRAQASADDREAYR